MFAFFLPRDGLIPVCVLKVAREISIQRILSNAVSWSCFWKNIEKESKYSQWCTQLHRVTKYCNTICNLLILWICDCILCTPEGKFPFHKHYVMLSVGFEWTHKQESGAVERERPDLGHTTPWLCRECGLSPYEEGWAGPCAPTPWGVFVTVCTFVFQCFLHRSQDSSVYQMNPTIIDGNCWSAVTSCSSFLWY